MAEKFPWTIYRPEAMKVLQSRKLNFNKGQYLNLSNINQAENVREKLRNLLTQLIQSTDDQNITKKAANCWYI